MPNANCPCPDCNGAPVTPKQRDLWVALLWRIANECSEEAKTSGHPKVAYRAGGAAQAIEDFLRADEAADPRAAAALDDIERTLAGLDIEPVVVGGAQ